MEWHQDCLVLTVLLASSFGPKEMRRLLKRSGYEEACREERGEALLAALHGACHQDAELRGAVAKDLGERFRSALTRAGGMGAEEILGQARETPWPLPLLWACFQSGDQEVRQAGRRVAHLVLWRGLRGAPEPRREERDQGRERLLAERNRELRGELAGLREERAALLAQVGCLRASCAAPPPACPSRAGQLKREAAELRQRLDQSERRRRELTNEVGLWRSLALGAPARPGEGPARPPAAPLPTPRGEAACPLPACDRACAGGCSLAGRTVAVVGGLKRLEKSYCQAVARMGGECLCHSGQMQAGSVRLRQLVAKADLVICIASVNSHGAMNVVKRECKLCRKPFCPLAGAGVGALENLLRQVGDGLPAPEPQGLPLPA